MGKTHKTVAVIGAGASGTLVCANLPSSVRVEWIGSDARFGPGLAFGTLDPEHLLNVPAIGMSAFPDEPKHFLNWVEKHHPELGVKETTFLQRRVYGEYLEQLVPMNSQNVHRHRDEVSNIRNKNPGFSLQLKSGAQLEVDEVVLALGNLDAHRDPGDVDLGATVLIRGTGLTMIDTVLSLRARGHRGMITAYSRRGLLPRVHTSYRHHLASEELKKLFSSRDIRLSQALRMIRNECRDAEAAGSNWRAVFDLLRPQTAGLWARLSPRQRRRFLRHLRAYWDVHRHRAAPDIHRKLTELQEQGALRILRARKVPGSFDKMIDCTGLSYDLGRSGSSLLQSLLAQKQVELDDPALGIHPSATAAGLHIVGPLLRGQFFESVAVPEIRVQARDLAKKLA